ncbi:MAG TPA: hypothetical protein VN851_15225 [Thermoanaerobaculia bacterium]|nr:hypothetical protein [Thermoanaerobaculia bacterium]
MSSSRLSLRSADRFALPALALLLAVSLTLSACGKKGPPLPPLRSVPATTSDLSVRQRGAQLLLEFTYPTATPGGQALGGITSVEVWEADRPVGATPAVPAAGAGTAPATAEAPKAEAPAEGAPATAGTATTDTTPTTPTVTEPIVAPGSVGTAVPPGPAGTAPAAPTAPVVDPGPPALDPREFALAGKKVLTLATADIGAATLGDKVVLMLPIVEAEAGVTVRHFQVRTVGPLGDRSEPSNMTRILPRTPPAPPAEIVATPKATGIDLSWQPVEGALGYLVYRRDAAVKNYGKPLQAVVAPAVSLTDSTAQLGASYIYGVTTVSRRAPLVESAIQSEREVRYADRYAPPPVSELVALAEQGQVRLIWTGSEAPDLAGYRIYRREGGELRRLNVEPVTATEFTDTNVASGRTYVYRVVAVDKSGNESTPQEVPATTR